MESGEQLHTSPIKFSHVTAYAQVHSQSMFKRLGHWPMIFPGISCLATVDIETPRLSPDRFHERLKTILLNHGLRCQIESTSNLRSDITSVIIIGVCNISPKID